MRPVSEANINWQASAANAAWRARALEKPKAAADLHGKFGDDPGRDPPPPRTGNNFTLRQSGTQEPVSFRHVRLTAAFTAQLLGQILPDPERPAAAASASAYGREPRLLSLGLDTRL